MRLIYILLSLIVVNGSYSKKDCKEVMMYLNQGIKTNEILNILLEDGVFLTDKISSMQDSSYIQIGSVAGRLLYKKYLKNFVEECYQFYWKAQQTKAKAEEAKKKKLEQEEEERKTERKEWHAKVDRNFSIIGWVFLTIVIGSVIIGICCWIYEEFTNRYTLQRKKQ